MSVAKAGALVGLAALVAGAPPQQDLWRARTRVPRPEFSGSGFAEMGEVLTSHLRRSFGRVVDCGSLALPALRELQARLFELADPELVSVYAGAEDNRRERHASSEALRAHWDSLAAATPSEAHPMLRDGLCHDVVMRFVHHTTEEVRALLAADTSFVLPTLPTHQHAHDGRNDTLAAHREYAAVTGCQACHSRLVPPPSPETSATCADQLKAQCGKRGQLMKDACFTCTAQSAAQLGACSADEITGWCDHPDACIGADECPVWPAEFSAPFTLYDSSPVISGAKCTFYYSYTAARQVQTVDYTERCFPLFGDLPCKLFFNPQGIFLSQPGRVDCCLAQPGVGAVPPEFLQSFTRVGQDVLAPDMYGNQVKCDAWEGESNFKYWTVGKDDPLYKNFGHDILFQDGPTGVTWRWGNFQALPADDSLFELPSSSCSTPCSAFLQSHELEALHRDAHVRRALEHHGRTAAPKDIVV